MTLLLVFFSISIIFSFLCSIWEAVLLSITPTQVEIELKKGTRTGELLKEMKENIDRPLAGILTLNTIAHTAGAIGVGAAAVKYWAAPEEAYIPDLIVPVVMTLAILILSEIIPKTIGATYYKGLTGFTVKSLNAIMWILWPLIWVIERITKVIKKNKKKSVLSRQDFSAMTDIGVKAGVFKKGESKIIQNLLSFNEVRTKDIMTPRTVIKTANSETSIADFYKENENLRFSRIPVFEGKVDKITGFVLKDELLKSIIENKGAAPLKSLQRPIKIVNDTLSVPTLFDSLMSQREHIALVVDEFGGTAGIVTMEDVIETLLGLEIMDEMDNITDMQALARKNWEKRAKDLGIITEGEK